MSIEDVMEDADLDEAMEAPEVEAAPEPAIDMSSLDDATRLRVIEAMIFMADAPVTIVKLQEKLGTEIDIPMLIVQLQEQYSARGIELVSVGGGYAFRTAVDLAGILKGEKGPEMRKPPRAATETLAIVAYHQPVTRAEIEAIRGVQVSRGTLDILMEAGWIRPGKRRETPGRPVTWLTTPQFLEHFGLSSLRDLPGIEELKAAGMLDAKPVLASIPAEPGFEDSHGGISDENDNDFLPAGDEEEDFNAPKSANAIRMEDEDEDDDAGDDEDADDDDYDDDDSDDGDDGESDDDGSDEDSDDDQGGDDADEGDDEDYDDEDEDDDDGDEDEDTDASDSHPRIVAAAE